ncbi:MAG: hypothetical protein F7C34_04830 [Desulfurococcales archaeon]|nr:hypothetical protein [Desulfurococcales archaeon]
MGSLGETWDCVERVSLPVEYAAEHLLRKGLRVLSTPCLVLAMERVARKCLDSRTGKTSVGYRVDVKHRKSLDLPAEVVIAARIYYWDERRALVYVRVETVEGELVGEGINERFSVEG